VKDRIIYHDVNKTELKTLNERTEDRKTEDRVHACMQPNVILVARTRPKSKEVKSRCIAYYALWMRECNAVPLASCTEFYSTLYTVPGTVVTVS